MLKRPRLALYSVRAGIAVGALFAAMTARSGMADELFVYADQAALQETMSSLGEMLAESVEPPTPCRLDIIHDLRGETLFDDSTLEEMTRALAKGVLGADQADSCVIEAHEISQEEATGFLIEKRQAGNAGIAAVLSYYKISANVTTLATLRNVDGRLLGSTTGLYALPVTSAGTGSGNDIAAVPSAEDETPPPEALAATTAELTESRPPELAPVVEPAPVVVREQATDAAVSSEGFLRQEMVEETRIVSSLPTPFNLRRIQAGIPSSIKTIRIADAGGQDVAMMAGLAQGFLSELASSPSASVETSDYGSNGLAGTRVSVEGGANIDAEAIDIQTTDVRSAFARVFDNEVDIVVTREPISVIEANRLSQAYGVNMRSRYAEHVVAVGTGEVETFDCGISYPSDKMLMSTEDHPTSQRIYLYVNPSVPADVRDRFVEFALSAEGQATVAKHAVDLRLQLSGASYATWRYQAARDREPVLPDVLSRFRNLIRTSERVSTTFRFEFASADLVLDSRSEQDLENLIDLIKTDGIDGRRVLLFGFADSVGAAPFNAGLSRDRAEAVATRLRLAGISVPPSNVHGIGEDSPVACDLTREGDRNELGAVKNRRVEVWIES